MVDIHAEMLRIEGARLALEKTTSPHLRRDLTKFIQRTEREIVRAQKYIRASERK